MQEYSITFRDSRTGKIHTRNFQACDRASLFKQLATQGIVPLSVTTGTRRGAGNDKNPVWIGACVTILAVLVVAVTTWAWIRSGRETSDDAEHIEQDVRNLARTVPSVVDTDGTRKDSVTKGNKKLHTTRPDPALTISAPTQKEEPTKKEDDVTDAPRRPKRLFENATDQLINLATSTPEGAPMPPLPPITREDTDRFILSLKSPVQINADDPPRVQEIKRRVQAVRDQIVQALEADPGRELGEILNGHRNLFNENSKLYAQSKAEYDELVASGDLEQAKKYREAVNAELVVLGAKQIENEDETAEEDNEQQEKQK